jgi:hypothetical protein
MVLAVFLALVLLGIAYLLLRGFGWIAKPLPGTTGAVITLIPAPTHTATSSVPTLVFTPTPGEPFLATGMMGLGAYVKVADTKGAGLRVRASGSTSAASNFVAMDEEVFLVIGGPEQSDGYTWWQLEAPYDKNRAGWAVSSFLQVIETDSAP